MANLESGPKITQAIGQQTRPETGLPAPLPPETKQKPPWWKNRLLRATSGLLLLGGCAVGLKEFTGSNPEPNPSASPSIIPSVEPSVAPSVTPSETTNPSVYEQQRKEVQSNIEKFFNLSREDFEKWARKDPFYFNEFKWGFPICNYPPCGPTSFLKEGNNTSIKYKTNTKIKLQPNLSFYNYNPLSEDGTESYELLGEYLGKVNVPIKDGGDVTVLFLGMFLPEEFSTREIDRFVYLINININKDARELPAASGVRFFTDSARVEWTLDKINGSYFLNHSRDIGSETITRQELFERLDRNLRHPLSVAVYNTGSKLGDTNISDTTVLNSAIDLFKNNAPAYMEKLREYRNTGKGVILPDRQKLPKWLKGFKTWQEAFEHAPLGFVGFYNGSHKIS